MVSLVISQHALSNMNMNRFAEHGLASRKCLNKFIHHLPWESSPKWSFSCSTEFGHTRGVTTHELELSRFS